MIRTAPTALAGALALALCAPAWANDTCKMPALNLASSYTVGPMGARISGSGNATSEERPAAGFAAVRVQGPFAVELKPAERERVTVRIDDNLQAMIAVEVVSDGTLELSTKRDASFTTRILPTVTVEYVKLNGVAVMGSGDVVGNNLRPAESFRAMISGSGDVCLSGVRTAKLELAVSGSGDIRAIGASDQVSVRISGSGDVTAQTLVGRDVKVSIAGSGDAKVQAIETLDVNIAGSGDVRYAGSPKLTRKVAGSGSIKPL